MGREGSSNTETFKNEAEVEKWIESRKTENKEDLETPNTMMDSGRDGYGHTIVRKVGKISGKSRDKCIADLQKQAEKELADAGDDTMVILYCEIDPTEPSNEVSRALQYQAQRVGKAFAATVKHAKYRKVTRGPKDEKETFVQCSNCNSQFALEYFKDSKGSCSVCGWTGENVPKFGCFYNELGQISENFGKVVHSTFEQRTKDDFAKINEDAFQLFVSQQKGKEKNKDMKHADLQKKCEPLWEKMSDAKKKPFVEEAESKRKRKREAYQSQRERTTVGNFDSKPLFVDSYEKSIQKVRDETQKYVDLEKELTEDPSQAKDKKKRKREKGLKIPVKKGKSAYQFFLSVQKDKKENKDLKLGELQKKCGPMWKALSEDEKKPFVKKAEKDKKRYEDEVEQYKTQNADDFQQYEKQQKRLKKVKEENNKKWVVAFEALSGHF